MPGPFIRLAAIPLAALIASGAVTAMSPVRAEVQPIPETTIAALVRGQPVIVSGVVERITDEDEFRLTDATGTVRVYVGPNVVPAATGEAITVTGVVDDDGPLEIYATAIIRADGTRVELPHRY